MTDQAPEDVTLDLGTTLRLPARVPVLGPDDQPIGWAILRAATADPDGKAAMATYDVHLDP
jgi:hypothetical protein